jgi:hypothetical protein
VHQNRPEICATEKGKKENNDASCNEYDYESTIRDECKYSHTDLIVVSYVAGEVIAASELITTQTVRLKKE